MAFKLNDLTTHHEAKQRRHGTTVLFLYVFSPLSRSFFLLKATSDITTVHMETQSWNIRPDLKARGWEEEEEVEVDAERSRGYLSRAR